MSTFEDFNLPKQLNNAVNELGFDKPTPIQEKAYSVILSGKDMVGIAQTGTGKTLAYLIPILRDLKFADQINPRILILVPTRELVLQMVENIESLTKYMNIRALGVYGGTNINTQKKAVAQGTDILVATPGRLYDLAVTGVLQLKGIKKLVIDEVDVMLDLGFRPQITNIFDLLKERRQNIMFSATMTEEVDVLIDDFFTIPAKISIAVSGTPLENIEQKSYQVKNFYTKINLLSHLLTDRDEFSKVLVFISTKKNADKLFEDLEEDYGHEACIIHSNKSQNYRIRSINQFDKGTNRILIATDVMARGLDLEKITHVINFDTPGYPENYMHRIGRTGRAEQKGKTILFFTEKEAESKSAIERLMSLEIPVLEFPEDVQRSSELLPEERPVIGDVKNSHRNVKVEDRGPAFHEKKLENTKTNQGGSYLRKAKKYKKPQKRGDKRQNLKSKKR
ncbi:MAG: DEAD/DEAH box helicase [Bacteroidales bacterium]|jgi:ATP-dependent RNA helicase RhlE|nr:DEAD/DEAH box helicase [Bacteroidales bacterium]